MKVCINTLIYYEQTNLYIRCCRKFIISYQEESKLSALRFLAAILVLLNKLLYDILYDSTLSLWITHLYFTSDASLLWHLS